MLDPFLARRSRALLASLFFLVTVACENEAPTPAYGMSPATPPGAQVPQQMEGDGAGDPSQMQTQDVPVGVQQDDYADTDPSALTDFHTTLDPHGQWIDDPTYGTIWVPNNDEVGPDFAPYVSNGGWEYDGDYVWNSYYDWGWAPFHYGRWMWVDSGRWGWIPGRRYSGAWVNWRTGPEGYDYVGWGPMQPSYVWRGGVAVSFGVVRPGPVVFCSRDDMFVRGVGRARDRRSARGPDDRCRDACVRSRRAHRRRRATGGDGIARWAARSAAGKPRDSRVVRRARQPERARLRAGESVRASIERR